MSIRTWFSGILPAVWKVFKYMLKTELARVAADPQTQALAKKAVTIAADYIYNTPDQRFETAVRELRKDFKALGKDLALGWASTIIQQAFYRARAEDPASITRAKIEDPASTVK